MRILLSLPNYKAACYTGLASPARKMMLSSKKMRLTHQQIDIIRLSAQESFGANVQVFLFGSRLDDNKLGGDIDIMLELTEAVVNPALLSAQFSAKLTRLLQGRKVDVLLAAPNLIHLPIHEIAFQQGQKL